MTMRWNWVLIINMALFFRQNNAPDRFISVISPTGLPLRNNMWLVRFGWLVPISVALAVYYVGLNNFFIWDDFVWLYKAQSFKQNWLQMFRPEEANYFDPLIHLMFVGDFVVGNLNPCWYHGVDLVIHAFNSFLIYRFARLLSDDDRTALYVGILFAGSFAIADAVLWSSSRVDLVSTLFSLGSLIQFLHYLSSNRKRNLFLAFLLFTLALTAKATPLILPLILLWLIIQKKKPLNYAVCLIPFGAVIVLYIVLLNLTIDQASLTHINIGNIFFAFCALFLPEGTLNYLGVGIAAPLLFIVVSAMCLTTIQHNSTVMIRRTGYCILLMAILPLLGATDFIFVKTGSNPINFLSSPSHRIYLASVGAALLGGGILRSIGMLLNKIMPRFATATVGLILVGLVTGDVFLVRERDKIWENTGNEFRRQFESILAYRGQIGEGSQIGAINFTSSPGFLIPMFKVCLGVNNIKYLNTVYIEMIEDQEILVNAEKSFLFVISREGYVHDKSQQFRQLLLLNRMAILNPKRTEYTFRCQAFAEKMYWEIKKIIE